MAAAPATGLTSLQSLSLLMVPALPVAIARAAVALMDATLNPTR